MTSSVIREIDKESVHRICSGQVVIDLSSAMKELVENSIDAEATTVEIIFKDNGLEGIEIIDNGVGIDPSNYEHLALKHYTSKITNFSDLEKVTTFGFRGEALSSLCALSKLVVNTATKAQAPKGVRLEYDHLGHLISKTPVARSVGTTVQLTDLFHSLPVRQREFKRNIKRDYSNALSVIQAYGIICTGTRIVASNQPSKGAKTRVLSTAGNNSVRENLVNLFDAKTVTQIMPYEIDLLATLNNSADTRKLDYNYGTVTGYISKPQFGHGRAKADRQYFYINGRPCHIKKMSKAFNEVYRKFVTNQYPFVVANFIIPPDSYDVNVSPDKRTIFLHQEDRIAEIIMAELERLLEPSRSTFGVSPLVPDSQPLDNAAIGTRLTSSLNTSLLGSFANESGKSYQPSSSSSSTGTKRTAKNTLLNYVKRPKPTSLFGNVTQAKLSGQADQISDSSQSIDTDTITTDEVDELTEEEGDEELIIDDSESQPILLRGLWRSIDECVTIGLRLSQLGSFIKLPSLSTSEGAEITALTSTLKQASLQVDNNETATAALDRVIDKQDFGRMDVIGQFNLGFIIGLLEGHDLFIIDQHAADEKYNFETLQQTTQIKGQLLIRPQTIDLTPPEELLVMDNIHIFQANGFSIKVNENQAPTKRISVLSQPASKNTMLDKKDISELVYLINERPGEMVRCSRIRDMFASRACRKSVMIGDPLTRKQMIKVVRHMGEISQPWNCPHGRPTMRHLMTVIPIREKVALSRRRQFSFNGSLFS